MCYTGNEEKEMENKQEIVEIVSQKKQLAFYEG